MGIIKDTVDEAITTLRCGSKLRIWNVEIREQLLESLTKSHLEGKVGDNGYLEMMPVTRHRIDLSKLGRAMGFK